MGLHNSIALSLEQGPHSLCHEEDLIEIGLERAVGFGDRNLDIDEPTGQGFDLIELNALFLFQPKPGPEHKLLFRGLSDPHFNLLGIGLIIMPEHEPHFIDTPEPDTQVLQRDDDELRNPLSRLPQGVLVGVENVAGLVGGVQAGGVGLYTGAKGVGGDVGEGHLLLGYLVGWLFGWMKG